MGVGGGGGGFRKKREKKDFCFLQRFTEKNAMGYKVVLDGRPSMTFDRVLV